MYIHRILLKNFKAITEMELEFQPGINLLIGDNGSGKTSVLEGIAVALGALFYNVEGVHPKNFMKDDVRIVMKSLGDSSSSMIYCEPVCAECELLTGNGETFLWNRIRKNLSTSKTTTDDKAICKWMRMLTNQPDANLPLISFQSAGRAWRVKRGDLGTELKKKLNDRRCAYIGCLDASMDVKAIQEWCMKQEMIALQKGEKIGEYEVFKKIISVFMKEMSELDEMPKVYYSPQFGEFVYKDKNEEMGISKLSAGYQSLLWMIMDLAYRVCLLNPELKELKKLEGIVLIDEVDMHLHPKWQWNIIKALRTTFENVQFIIATHSPIVIASAKDMNLLQLNHANGVVRLSDCYGYPVEDVLLYRQESSSRPRQVKELMDKMDEVLEEDDFVESERVLSELKNILGEKNSEYRRMERIVEDAKLIEEL